MFHGKKYLKNTDLKWLVLKLHPSNSIVSEKMLEMIRRLGTFITTSTINKLFCCFMYWGYSVRFHWEKLSCVSIQQV